MIVFEHAELQTQSADLYTATNDQQSLSFGDAIERFANDQAFRDLFLATLRASRFSAFRWETPPVTLSNLNRPFEFVLLESAYLARPNDRQTFAKQFAQDSDGDGVVVFDNLGRDATMIVPCPQSADCDYSHIAGFVRGAPAAQQDALWQAVGQTVQSRLRETPLWLNTAGGGVAWLHVRLDSRPKYYHYRPYTQFSNP